MFKKIIFTVCLFIVNLNAGVMLSGEQNLSPNIDFNNSALSWVNKFVIDDKKNILLSEQSIKLVADFLAVSYELTILNATILEESQNLLKLSWGFFESNLNSKFNNLPDIQAEKIKEVVYRRKLVLELNEQILSQLEKTEDQNLKNAFQALYTNIQELVNQAMLAKEKELGTRLLLASKNLDNGTKILNSLAGIYQALFDDKYVFGSIPGFECLFKINESLKVARISAEKSWETLISSDPVFEFYYFVSTQTRLAIETYYRSFYNAIKFKFNNLFEHNFTITMDNKAHEIKIQINSIKYEKKII